MMERPDPNPLKAIDREAFRALRKDPAKLEAHLDGMLAAVHDRMMAPFKKEPVVSYHTFPKAPVVDLSKLAKMPSFVGQDVETATAPTPAVSTPPAASPTVPETAHPPAPKSTVSFPPVASSGTLIHQSVVTPPRGYIQNDLPDSIQKAPLHTDISVSEKPQEPQIADELPRVAKPKPVVQSPVIMPKAADADAVKKRFEERQSGLGGLFKDKGNLT